jgi:hypothetical protein
LFEPDFFRVYNKAGMARSSIVSTIISEPNPVKRFARSLLSRKLRQNIKNSVRRWNVSTFTPPPMRPETRSMLGDYYAEPNRKLAKLLERDLSFWDVSAG